MPSAIVGPSKEGHVWVFNDAEDKMFVPEGTIMGIDQDWEEEVDQEMEEYSESVGAIRGVGEVIPEHMKDMFDRVVVRLSVHVHFNLGLSPRDS